MSGARDPGEARRSDAALPLPERDIDPLRRCFAENLIASRRRAELSQKRVAERSGLHISEIELLERGLRLPRLGTIVRLGGALEVDSCELIVGMAWRPGPEAGQPSAGNRRGRFEVKRSERSEPS